MRRGTVCLCTSRSRHTSGYAKYTYWLIRPLQADGQITMPIALPSFPSYPSNHALISAAPAVVFGDFFPAHRQSLMAQVEEAGISRVNGGDDVITSSQR